MSRIRVASVRVIGHINPLVPIVRALCGAATRSGGTPAASIDRRSRRPARVLGVIPHARSSVDTAPFGLGLAPDRSPLGHLRNRALNWAGEHVVFRDVQQHWNATRQRVGLPATGWWLNAGDRASVYMQPSIPSLEHYRSDLPGNVRLIGMIPADTPRDWMPPDFWHELHGSRPRVVAPRRATTRSTSQ